MKTFEEYLIEATTVTAKDVAKLPGATAKNLKTQQTRQNARIAAKKVTSPAVTKPQIAGAAKEKTSLPAGKKGGPLSRIKKPVSPSSKKFMSKPDDQNVKQDTVTSTSTPRPSTTKSSMTDKARDIARTRAQNKLNVDKAKKKPGFTSGLASSLGGDSFRKGNDADSITKRKEARNKLGKSIGNYVKSVPGKATKDTIKSGGATSSSSTMEGPKRGVYNG